MASQPLYGGPVPIFGHQSGFLEMGQRWFCRRSLKAVRNVTQESAGEYTFGGAAIDAIQIQQADEFPTLVCARFER